MPRRSPRSHRLELPDWHSQKLGQTSMNDEPRRRGRPKGTGIKDDATLEVIANFLAEDADLKPTTAIRRAGITDPSVVRRLRDKLKLVAASAQPTARQAANTVAPIAAKTLPAAPRRVRPPRPAAPHGPNKAARALAASSAMVHPVVIPAIKPPLPQPPTAHVADPATAPTASANSSSEAPHHSPIAPASVPPDPQLEALRLAADAAAAMSRLYLHCLTFAAQTNPFGLALRSQVMMSQWMSTMITAQMAAPKGLKSE